LVDYGLPFAGFQPVAQRLNYCRLVIDSSPLLRGCGLVERKAVSRAALCHCYEYRASYVAIRGRERQGHCQADLAVG
jgi:hypothetical protein